MRAGFSVIHEDTQVLRNDGIPAMLLFEGVLDETCVNQGGRAAWCVQAFLSPEGTSDIPSTRPFSWLVQDFRCEPPYIAYKTNCASFLQVMNLRRGVGIQFKSRFIGWD